MRKEMNNFNTVTSETLFMQNMLNRTDKGCGNMESRIQREGTEKSLNFRGSNKGDHKS